MISEFLTAGGRLKVPDSVSDNELEQRGIPARFATKQHIYSKDNYWTSDLMVAHTLETAVPIFEASFPGYVGVFAFDNATNHCAYSGDALRVSNLNWKPGGKQPCLRDGYFNGQPQKMQFEDGTPKGVKQILAERGLLTPNMRFKCKDECSQSGSCCGQFLLSQQPDFLAQKGILQERLEARGHKVLFYPKFHCELNFIERYWSSTKRYTRDHCDYTFSGLQQTLPAAFESVSFDTIKKYYLKSLRLIDAYKDGVEYGTAQYDKVYKSHRRLL